MRSARRRLLVFAAALLTGSTAVNAGEIRLTHSRTAFWYDAGHRLVARLAETRLTARTAASVRQLLGGQSLAEAATWADRVRLSRPSTTAYHFVNIPLSATGYDPARDCPEGRCIIAAIESDRRILADTSATPAERAEALRFLAHFLGDLHQPLHVGSAADRGGNDRHVIFLGTAKNLHEVWDGELVAGSLRNEAGYFERLRRLLDSLGPEALARGTVVDWAMEGHRIAAERAYRLPPGDVIDQAYVRANAPYVDRALASAGARLARVLNEALGGAPILPPGRQAEDHPAGARFLPTYTDLEAAAHVGETATVVGTVASVRRSRSGSIYLNFGADYPHQSFTGAVLHPRGSWATGLDSLEGQRVGVRGKIGVYRGQAQIVIERADQIRSRSPASSRP